MDIHQDKTTPSVIDLLLNNFTGTRGHFAASDSHRCILLAFRVLSICERQRSFSSLWNTLVPLAKFPTTTCFLMKVIPCARKKKQGKLTFRQT